MAASEELKRKISKANKRLRTLRKSGHGNISAIPLALKQMEIATGTKQKNFFKIGRGKKTDKDYEKIETQIDRFLESEWSTVHGIKAITTRSASTLQKKEGLSDSQIANAIDTFQLDVYSKAMELGGLASKQVVQAFKDNTDAVTMEKALTEYVKRISDDDGKNVPEDERFQVFLDILEDLKKDNK